MKWVLVLVANSSYLDRALFTIQLARTTGCWNDDIVLITDKECASNSIFEHLESFCTDIVYVPNIPMDSVEKFWDNHTQHENYKYIKSRPFIYSKFYVMDFYFKKWDYVFYLDAGAVIFDSLERFKVSCIPDNCFLAHSDAYINTHWKLKRQFNTELDTNMSEKLHKNYGDLDCDYFQSTIFIYDTKILSENYVNKLFSLANEYPFSYRMDQGIFNLVFHIEKNLWKQIPVEDSHGFLYDYLPKPGFSYKNYCILKVS
jgi:hypothetical protein